MKPKSIKVILIDPFNHEVEEKHMDGTLQSIYDLIGCELFEVVRIDAFTELYVDEEALINGTLKGFMVRGMNQPIFGRAIVVGHPDRHGNTTGTNLSVDGARRMLSHWVERK